MPGCKLLTPLCDLHIVARHAPQHTSHAMALTTLPNTADPATIIECFERDGAVIVENLISDATLVALREGISKRQRGVEPGSRS